MPDLTSPARPYRMGMWIFLVLCIPFLALALAGARRLVNQDLGIFSMAVFFICLAGAVLMGYQSRRLALDDRQRTAKGSMLVIMASMLKEEDSVTLEKIVAKGGPAGEAAALILRNRKTGG
ncbi:MAG: hypothetical protein ABI679_07570 [Gemmatimonadota bacterium]